MLFKFYILFYFSVLQYKNASFELILIFCCLQGRSTVRNGGYRECEQAKGIITRNTTYHRHKPLKVLVMHSAVVSHQTFSLKVLTWLIKIAAQAGESTTKSVSPSINLIID